MEEKTGCVSRDQQCRKAVKQIVNAANTLAMHSDADVVALAEDILSAAKDIKE